MSVTKQNRNKHAAAFSSVDGDNVHVAIAATIAKDLWERHPNVHFQTLGPAKGSRIPGEARPLTQAVVTFTFARPVQFCERLQNLNHVGTISINNGACVLQVTDPAGSSYNDKRFLIDKEWPLEFPGFPEVMYDELAQTLSEAVGDEKDQSKTRPFLYEISKKGSPRHLTSTIKGYQIVTLCGQKIIRSEIDTIKESSHYTRDGRYCCNCTESRIYKERRGR